MTSLFLIMMLLAQEARGGKPAPVPYRLLKLDLPNAADPVKEISVAVSVERSLSRPGVEKLICQILGNEKPRKNARLNMRVFLNLDACIPDVDPDSPQGENGRHQLAWYVWTRSLPRVRGRLVISKDAAGNQLEPWQSREFDHEKSCPSPR